MLHPDVRPDDHVRGPANAPLTLVEYGDYQCPHCGRANLILDVVLRELGDAVRFVFRHFPLTEMHPLAKGAAEAAESVAADAGDDAFWAMHDMLYANQDALEVDELLGYAAAAGADPVRVADDLASRAMAARVDADVAGGMRSGVTGTPAFFVNGRRFTGNWTDADAFTAALQSTVSS
jgi:NhaA family Na+:H+ antiporter